MITVGEVTLTLSFFVFSWVFFTVMLLIIKHIHDNKDHCTKFKWFGMISMLIASLSGIVYNLVPALAANDIYRIAASCIGTVAIVANILLFIRSCKSAYDAEFKATNN